MGKARQEMVSCLAPYDDDFSHMLRICVIPAMRAAIDVPLPTGGDRATFHQNLDPQLNIVQGPS
jgi:hypothetical protein